MRTQGLLIALSLTVSLGLTGLTVAQNEPARTQAKASPIGKVVSATGAVTIERVAPTAAAQPNIPTNTIPAKADDFVYQGDVIATGADGKASLAFADGTAFNISSNARMELNEFVYNPNGNSNSSMFSLIKGTFTFVAGKIAKTGSMKLDTPVATMGIRGTTPHVVVNEDGTVKFSTLVEEKR
jgi:hypothetical protein